MNIRKELYKSTCLFSVWEIIRYGWSKSFGSFICEPTPVWYNFDSKCPKEKKEYLEIDENWYKLNRTFYYKENIFYSIENALAAKPDLKGIALVFFMGIGEYLYTTPLIEAIAKAYPKLKIYAYTSNEFSKNVANLLKSNPNISEVSCYDGYPNPFVENNYYYGDILKDLPKDVIVMPLVYKNTPDSEHRVISTFKTFKLQAPSKKNIPAPLFYFKDPKETLENIYKKIHKISKYKKGVVFLHLDSKEFGYLYPHRDDIVRNLIREDYFVISASESAVLDESFYKVDNDKLSFNDVAQLLSMLKAQQAVYMISLNSAFWPVSAALDITNLGLQPLVDLKVHTCWYPNISVITTFEYETLPKNKMFFAWPENYTNTRKKLITYESDFVLKCFYKMISKVK